MHQQADLEVRICAYCPSPRFFALPVDRLRDLVGETDCYHAGFSADVQSDGAYLGHLRGKLYDDPDIRKDLLFRGQKLNTCCNTEA